MSVDSYDGVGRLGDLRGASSNRGASVVFVTGDPVGPTMAGPAIRTVELARVVAAAGHRVTVAAPSVGTTDLPAGIRIEVAVGEDLLRPLVAGADVVVAFAAVVADNPWLGGGDAVLVVDAYDPGLLETLERHRGEPVNEQRDWAAAAQRHLVEPLRHADVVMVASDRQRHLTVGILAAHGRLTPRVVAEDPTLDRLVPVVPFGTPAGPAPDPTTRPITGPGGLVGEPVAAALWGGGLYDWLDPLTLVDAVSRTDRHDIVAVFLAGRHPTPAVGHAPLVDRARHRAEELGLLGERVFFHEEWVPYLERIDWLADAAVGVSLHHRHVETEFAFRTRILDYLWAGLPVVCTRGDHWSRSVADRELGLVVEAGDADGVASALDALVTASDAERGMRRERARIVAEAHAWPLAASALVEACDAPMMAPDRRLRGPAPGALHRTLGAARRVTGASRRRW